MFQLPHDGCRWLILTQIAQDGFRFYESRWLVWLCMASNWNPDCSRWLDMALNGHMATNGLIWLDEYLDGSRWLQLAIYGSRRLIWLQMAPVGYLWFRTAHMALNRSYATIWLHIVVDGFRWLQIAPDCSRLLQIAPVG